VSRQRRRFTLGHELGHFLMPSHVPDAEGRFLCSQRDLLLLSAKEGDRRARMEIEANRFSSLILMPPPALRTEIGKRSAPSLEHMLSLAKKFDVSKEAMARAYAEYHSEAIAFVVVREGKVLRTYSNKTRFPLSRRSATGLCLKDHCSIEGDFWSACRATSTRGSPTSGSMWSVVARRRGSASKCAFSPMTSL
jgi:IrrE N-terminal-like domain